MRHLSRTTIWAAILAGGVLLGPAAAMDIAVTGNWTVSVDATDLLAGAGSDLQSDYESNSRQGLIDIYNVPKGQTWRVDVRRSDSTWHPDLAVHVRRTSGSTHVWGGTSYRQVGTTYSPFFSGDKNANNIAIQLKLTGVSVNVPPATYSTTVIYTVVDTGG